MYDWILTDPELSRHIQRVRRERAITITRVSYRAIVSIERAVVAVLGGVFKLGRSLWGAYRANGQRRAAIAQLRRLDDKSLQDIGLHRGEIRSVVEGMLSHAEEERRVRDRDIAASAKSVTEGIDVRTYDLPRGHQLRRGPDNDNRGRTPRPEFQVVAQAKVAS